MEHVPLLAIELSGAVSTVALALPGGAIRERTFGGERGRALMAEVDALLSEADLSARGLRAVVVGTGPGSYTGLRIACAAARTLAFALGVAAGGIGSLEVAALAGPDGRELHLLVDAFRREVYHACYRRAGAEVIELIPPRILARSAAARALPPGALLLGDPALLADPAADEADTAPLAIELLAPAVEPRARALARLALLRGPAAWRPAEPLYLRAAR